MAFRLTKIILLRYGRSFMSHYENLSELDKIRHSCTHVMAAAVLRLFPKTKLWVGPPTDLGFYYDFDPVEPFTTESLPLIEMEMKKIIKENQRFERIEVSREKAYKKIEEMEQPYKSEILNNIPEGEKITFYKNGEFVDLCQGGHVSYTKKIKAFKLLSIAGAYLKGDQKEKQLQRLYGTAFPNKEALGKHLDHMEAAKQRDHRKIGKDMGLFHIDESVGQGMVLWTPKGSIIRQQLQDFILKELQKRGYDQVFTPHIGKLDLFRTSGHFPYYKDSQFTPILEPEDLRDRSEKDGSCRQLSEDIEQGTIEGFLLRPMNCPMHIKIFQSQPRSYRDLPVRLAEFGTVYRWEQSGELNGMTRVRGFTQDDAHLFCTEEQLEEEILGCLDLVKLVFKTLGMDDYRVRIGLRDPDSSKYTGDPERWEKAEQALRKAVRILAVDYTEEPGEAAFYGPKIDFVVKDVIGREWQLGTVQVDYNLPERFNILYTGSDNRSHRPVMIHRAPFGSIERFCGVLIEHFAGNFPTWLAPEQVRILTLSQEISDYGYKVLKELKQAGIRAHIDDSKDKIGAKIRRAELQKVPHMVVVGKRELEEEKVSVRSRIEASQVGTFSISEFLESIKQSIDNKKQPDSIISSQKPTR